MGIIGVYRRRLIGRSTLFVGLCLMVPLLGPRVAVAQYGTIKGRLVWGGDTAIPSAVLEEKGKADKDPNVCAKDQSIISHELEIDPTNKGVKYGYAYIVRPKGANPGAVKALVAAKPTVEVDQKNCDFVPHSTAIHVEQTLVLKSSDPTGHNVRLTGFANSGLNQNVAPNGQISVKLQAERLPMRVACDIHPWMHGHVMIFDHPFFAVTGSDGSFEIKGVPEGEQNVVVWQEKVGYVTPGAGRGTPVKVVAEQVTEMPDVKIDPAKK
jgi:plastocyanin